MKYTRALAALVALTACNGSLFTIKVSESATTTVEKGTIVEELLVDFGFSDFVTMDVTAAQELQNQGVEPGDIKKVRLELFEVEAVAPDGADLSFIDELELFVEAPDIPAQRIAHSDAFAGNSLVALELDDVDLTEYVVSQSLTISTEVSGRRPDVDTDVEARFRLAVGITGQGVGNNL